MTTITTTVRGPTMSTTACRVLHYVKCETARQLRKGSYCWHGGGCRHTPECDPVCADVSRKLPY